MPRTLHVGVTSLFGAISEYKIYVNHNLVATHPLANSSAELSWAGEIPLSTTSIKIEAFGVDTTRYSVRIVLDNEVVTDVDRELQNGTDVFHRAV